MRLGFFINAFRHFPLDYGLDKIQELGYEGVELWGKGNHFTPFDGCEQFLKIAKDIRNRGLEIYAISAHLDFVSPESDRRECETKKFFGIIEAAVTMGVKVVHTASGGVHQSLSYQEQEDNFLVCMEVLGKAALKNDVVIGLEAEPEKWLSTPAQLIDLIENKLPDRAFKVVVDLGHAFGVSETPRTYLEKLAQHLVTVHVDDVRESDFPHEHLIPGEGDVDYLDVFRTLREIGYDGWLSMELNRHNDKPALAAEQGYQFMMEHKQAWGIGG